MSQPTNSPAVVLLKTYRDLEELLRLYAIAVDIQHERPRRGESVGRQKGTHSDPTAGAVMDPYNVRGTVKKVEASLDRLHDQVAALKSQLEQAIDRWDGA